MHIRCPHCHNPVEVVGNDFADVSCPSCGSHFSLISSDTTATYAAGASRTIGHFELIHQVGVGAFGSVWKARDKELDRIVAVKIPRRDQLNAEEADTFFRGARAAAQVKHPGIVGTYEVGRDGETIYIVSDFVDGADLKQWLTSQRLSARESAELVANVAAALHHAHEAGVVHRDLKPGNIMLDLDGQPHITDFGLAKRESGEISITMEGKPLGTPNYMPPEQAMGEGHHADRRSDVYSLGVILFELLTGELPFRGEAQMVLVQIQKDEPPRPRKLNAKIPRDLETITLKCLEKDSTKRYQTAQALADDLQRWLKGEPILARPISQVARGWRWCKRNPAVAGLSAAAVFALVAGTSVSSYYAIMANMRASEAISERDRADQSAQNERRARETSRRLLYNADMNLADRMWAEAHVDDVSELIARHKDDQDLQGFEWHYQRRLLECDLRTLGDHASQITEVLFSPAGRLLASADGGGITLWDVETGAELRKFKDGVAPMSFSPDGRRIASSSSSGYHKVVKVWDVERGQEALTLKGHTNQILSVDFSPDGRWIASAGYDDTVKIWNAETGAEVHELEGNSAAMLSVLFSRDGRRLASAGGDDTIQLWDTETGTLLGTLLAGHSDPESYSYFAPSVSFSPDGKRLISAWHGPTINLWDVERAQETLTLKGHTNQVMSVDFSPDGRWIASASADGTVKLWNAETGAEIRTIKGHTGSVGHVLFSPDGRSLASCDDRTMKLWNVEDGAEIRTLKGHNALIWSVTFYADGRLLASASEDGTVKLWDVEISDELRNLKGHTNRVNSLSFSPNGRSLASASSDATIKLWDVETGAEVRTLKEDKLTGHNDSLVSLMFNADGRRIASANGDGTVKLWDPETGAELRTHKGLASRVGFSPDGSWFANVSDSHTTVNVRDVETGQETLKLKGIRIDGVALSRNGRRLALAGEDKTIKLWDTENSKDLCVLKGHSNPIHSVTFSPDGRRLVAASCDSYSNLSELNWINLWDTETGTQLHTLKSHTGGVATVCFSPDGRRIASAGEDQTIKLWDTESGVELRTLKGHTGTVRSLAFSPDGQRLASSGDDQTIKLWDATSYTSDEKMARSLARQIIKQHPMLDDALGEIAKQTHWNEAMREAAVKYVRAAKGR